MFPTFPDFIPLNIELKDPYNSLVKSLPPYSDISFATLQTWWNLNEKLTVSLLNQNLIINYNQPFKSVGSGLSLIGTNNVDNSIETIFQYLKSQKAQVHLIHEPEFVIDKIKNPNKLNIIEEPDYHEYLLDSEALANLKGAQYKLLRKKIKRFKSSVGERNLELKSLDLSILEVQDHLFKSISDWEKKISHNNDLEHTEFLAIKKTLKNSKVLNIKSLALYIDKELHGVIIYHRPFSKEYYIMQHMKVNYETPYITDYMHHEIAKKAYKSKVSRLNIEMDLGIDNIRRHKLTLRPLEYFKKYNITPKE